MTFVSTHVGDDGNANNNNRRAPSALGLIKKAAIRFQTIRLLAEIYAEEGSGYDTLFVEMGRRNGAAYRQVRRAVSRWGANQRGVNASSSKNRDDTLTSCL